MPLLLEYDVEGEKAITSTSLWTHAHDRMAKKAVIADTELEGVMVYIILSI